jgi:DNA-binding MarR family transcriptional regulator
MDDSYDSGLFQHDARAGYLHLLREVLLTYRQLMRGLSGEMGVSGAQFEVLRELALADGRSTVSELASEVGVDRAAVSRLVAGLHELGFVSRETDERDRRRQPVVLTEAGRGLMLSFHAKAHEREAAMTASLDQQSIETAMRVLRTLRDSLVAPSARRR